MGNTLRIILVSYIKISQLLYKHFGPRVWDLDFGFGFFFLQEEETLYLVFRMKNTTQIIASYTSDELLLLLGLL